MLNRNIKIDQLKWCVQRGKEVVRWADPQTRDHSGPLLFTSEGDARAFVRKVAGRGWQTKRIDSKELLRLVDRLGNGKHLWVGLGGGAYGYVDLQQVHEDFRRQTETGSSETSVPMRRGLQIHEDLPDDLRERVRRVYDSSGHYVCASWEQWEMGFTREANLRAEVELWEAIDSVFRSYLGSGSISPAKAQEVLGYLCIIAGGGPVPDDDLGRELKRLYNGPMRPVRATPLPDVAVSKVEGDGHWQSLPKVPVEELESMGCQLRTAYLRNLDLIVAHNRDNGSYCLMFGRQELNELRNAGQGKLLSHLVVDLSFETEYLEWLSAAVMVAKHVDRVDYDGGVLAWD